MSRIGRSSFRVVQLAIAAELRRAYRTSPLRRRHVATVMPEAQCENVEQYQSAKEQTERRHVIHSLFPSAQSLAASVLRAVSHPRLPCVLGRWLIRSIRPRPVDIRPGYDRRPLGVRGSRRRLRTSGAECPTCVACTLSSSDGPAPRHAPPATRQAGQAWAASRAPSCGLPRRKMDPGSPTRSAAGVRGIHAARRLAGATRPHPPERQGSVPTETAPSCMPHQRADRQLPRSPSPGHV